MKAAAAEGGWGGDRGGVVLFDGECNLCTGAVRFITRRDPGGRFRFAPLGSEAGRVALAGVGEEGEAERGTMVLIQGGRAYRRSDAALRVARGLRWPWPLLWGLVLVPRRLRDRAYGLVARNRHRWFGRRERGTLTSCKTPHDK
jgi:predicted DCC family thiol-disulfide oxidoreductase YuxK